MCPVRYRTTFTLVDNAHPQRRRTVRTKVAIATGSSVSEKTRMSRSAIARNTWSCAHPLYSKFCGMVLVCGATISAEPCRAMTNDFLVPEFEDDDMNYLWFQHGYKPYSQRNNIFIEGNFWGARYLAPWACSGPSPRWCNLTPLDYFLWFYVNSLVYAIASKRFNFVAIQHR